MKKLLIITLLFSFTAIAQYERPGSTDGQFLKIGVSPRGTSMADAYISQVDGAEATYYNSAALAWLDKTDIVFNHTVWFAGINHDFAAVAKRFGDIGSFGLSVTGLYTDEMKVTTPLQPNGTGETFYASNYRIGLTYSRYFTDKVTIGTTISYIYMSLFRGFESNGVAIDIAAMYKSEWRDFNFAMQIANFGSNIQYVNESYPLPTNFTFGASLNAIELDNQALLVSFAAVKPNDGSPLLQMGTEWNYNDMFFVRGGYHFSHDVAQYSFGAGVNVNVSGIGLRSDYSYSDYSLLGASHRFGIGIRLDY